MLISVIATVVLFVFAIAFAIVVVREARRDRKLQLRAARRRRHKSFRQYAIATGFLKKELFFLFANWAAMTGVVVGVLACIYRSTHAPLSWAMPLWIMAAMLAVLTIIALVILLRNDNAGSSR